MQIKSAFPLYVGGGLSGVTYALGLFIAVGTDGHLATSADGTNWNVGNSGTFSDLSGVATGNGLVLASGNSITPDGQSNVWTVVGSTNGTDWSEYWSATVDRNEGYLRRITFGQGLFLLGGSAGIWSSTDGQHWTKQYATNPFDEIWCLAYGNGQFVAGVLTGVAGPAPLLTSTNGIAWKNVPFAGPGVDMPDRILDVSSGGGLLVLTAYKFFNYPVGQSIFTSVDGVQWTWHGYVNQRRGARIAYGPGRFVNFTESGIMSCDVRPRLGPISLSPVGVAASPVLGVSGLRYDVEASTNLIDWVAVTNVLAPNGTAAFIDPAAAGKKQRFYRTKSDQ